MKKIIIFEGLKGAGKTTLINQFIEEKNKYSAFFEEDTFEPLRNEMDMNKINKFYDNLINKFQECDNEIILLDRFYFTKWSSSNYDKSLFCDLEKKLLEEFDVSLILLTISEEHILERLKGTQEYRRPSGRKVKPDSRTIEEEAKRDVFCQSFFLENQYRDSLIKNKVILDTTDVANLISDTKGYTHKISREFSS